MQTLGEYKYKNGVLFQLIGGRWQPVYRPPKEMDINREIVAYKSAFNDH